MNVLLSCYSCIPGRGSEPGIGWNAAKQVARFHTVWVLAHGEGRQEIEAALTKEAFPNVQFVILDLPSWALFWKKGRRGQRLHYYFWQLAAYFVARKLHRKVEFDVVHHVTFAQYAAPSFVALLPVPFVWGPVGGGESAPAAFWWSFSLRGKLFELARSLGRVLGEHDPFVRLTARRTALGLATTEETARQMRLLGCKRVSVMPGIALPQEEIQHLSSMPTRYSSPFRLLSVGNLIHWKGYHLGLQAFAQFHHKFPESEYWLIGQGPEHNRLKRLAANLGIEKRVTFWGDLPRQQVLEKLSDCDVLLHPSFHDSGGWACLEGMAAGRPVVCLDLGGPGLQVTDDTGIKVKAGTRAQTVADLAKAFVALTDVQLRMRLAKASRRRVEEHFDWAGKGESMNRIYQDMQLAASVSSTPISQNNSNKNSALAIRKNEIT